MSPRGTSSSAKTPILTENTELIFFDTNILIYAFLEQDPRRLVAKRLLAEGGRISVQVLNEFVAVTRRRFKTPWSELREILRLIHLVCGEAAPISQSTHERAVEIAQLHQLHIYDATILASAIESGCDTLHSEDIQHGQQIETVTIRNPFLKIPT
jgi:predicted nucleic acid-binding protein